jgi:hypothetical protein
MDRLVREVELTARAVERRISEMGRDALDLLTNELVDSLGLPPLALGAETVQFECASADIGSSKPMRYAEVFRRTPSALAGGVFAARIAIAGLLTAVLPAAALAGVTYVAGKALSRIGIGRAVDEAAQELPGLVDRAFEELRPSCRAAARKMFDGLASDLQSVAEGWRQRQTIVETADRDPQPSSSSASAESATAVRARQLLNEVQHRVTSDSEES